MKKKFFMIVGLLASLLFISDVKAWYYATSWDGNYTGYTTEYPGAQAYGNDNIPSEASSCDGSKVTASSPCGFSNSSTQNVTEEKSTEQLAQSYCETENTGSINNWINKGYRCQINYRKGDPQFYAYKYPLFVNGYHNLREIAKEGNNIVMYVYRIYPILINYDGNEWYRPPYPGGGYPGNYSKINNILMNSEYIDDWYSFYEYNDKKTYDSYNYLTRFGKNYNPKKIEYIDSSVGNFEPYNYKLKSVKVVKAGNDIINDNYKREVSGQSLFYEVSGGPKDFLKKYALDTSENNYGITENKVITKSFSMKTINGSIYGESIKALKDSDNAAQRDYAYYHVYLTKYTFEYSSDPIIPPTDCKITNQNDSTSSDVKACSSTKIKTLKSYCKYEDTGKVINYYKKVYPILGNKNKQAEKKVRNDLCYITTDNENGDYEKISYNLNLQKEGDYLNPELIIEHTVNYTIHYTGNDNAERIRCYNNGMGKGTAINHYKITTISPNFISSNIGNGLKAIISYPDNNKQIEKEVSLKKEEEPIIDDQSCNADSETSNQCKVHKKTTYKYKLNNNICSGATRNYNTFENGMCACPVEEYFGKIVKITSGKITIKINNNSDNAIGGCEDNFLQDTTASYTYRPISLENPFPGITGNGRKVGANWLETNEGDPVETVIKTKMDKKNPMYVINLTPDAIKEIRARYSNNYSEDVGQVDDETKACEALNNGKYISGMIQNLSKIPATSSEGSPSIIEGRCITNKQIENRKCVENFSS